MRRLGALLAFARNDEYGMGAVAAMTRGLEHLGWVDGRNIRVDYRFASGDAVLYRTHAAELVGLSPDLIFAGASLAVQSLKAMTRTIPIVFAQVADPVGLGFVRSLARPGDNITGFSTYDAELMGKWLGLLREVAPSVKRVAVMYNPDTTPFAALYNNAIDAAAPSLGLTVSRALVYDPTGIESTIAAHASQPGGGLVIPPESFTVTHRDIIIAAAARHSLPAIAGGDIWPRAGALMSYWMDTIEMHAQAMSYVDRILKGERPATLPVQQPTKFSLIINLKTAKALGLKVPPGIRAIADEVIE
jgi:putative ABC transport system substrate-binding protein